MPFACVINYRHKNFFSFLNTEDNCYLVKPFIYSILLINHNHDPSKKTNIINHVYKKKNPTNKTSTYSVPQWLYAYLSVSWRKTGQKTLSLDMPPRKERERASIQLSEPRSPAMLHNLSKVEIWTGQASLALEGGMRLNL